MPDMKGDLSGIAKEGQSNDKINERAAALGINYTPSGFPVELYSLSGKLGAQMRATVTEFGPTLLSKILLLNDTQAGVLNIVYKYADDKNLPIVDFNDLKKVLNYLTEGPGAAEIKSDYGKISTATSSTILRKIVSLEQQGVNQIFGETSFDIQDLFDKVDGRGVISILNVADIQNQPAIFSTFMLSLLAELYQRLPEAGDLDKPKLIFFLDEAHLLFQGCSQSIFGSDRSGHPFDPFKRRWCIFLHATNAGYSPRCVGATGQPGTSRYTCLHTQRCKGFKGNRENFSQFRIL